MVSGRQYRGVSVGGAGVLVLAALTVANARPLQAAFAEYAPLSGEVLGWRAFLLAALTGALVVGAAVAPLYKPRPRRILDVLEIAARRTVTVKPPTTVASLSDPTGDDHGPGAYTYPTAGAFEPGAFDLQSTTVERTDSLVQFTFEVGRLYNAFDGSNGFSPQMFVVWIRDPTSSGGATESLDDIGANVTFEKPWHYRLRVDGFNRGLVNSSGGPVTDDGGDAVTPRVAADTESGTVTVSFDRSALGDVETSSLEVVPMVQSEDRGSLRPVVETADSYVFGGAKPDAVGNTPLIVDLITPDGVSQSAALAYDADTLASLPFVPLDGE